MTKEDHLYATSCETQEKIRKSISRKCRALDNNIKIFNLARIRVNSSSWLYKESIRRTIEKLI